MLDRINSVLIPTLSELGYISSVIYIKEFGTTPLLQVQKNNKGKVILIVPWIRPFSTNKNETRVLNDYPRLNVSKQLKNSSDDEKIHGMISLVNKYHLYFLVVMQKTESLYWVDLYENIPLDFWKTTYRKKGMSKDRIHFPNYRRFNFVKKEEFKKQLNKLQNEN